MEGIIALAVIAAMFVMFVIAPTMIRKMHGHEGKSQVTVKATASEGSGAD